MRCWSPVYSGSVELRDVSHPHHHPNPTMHPSIHPPTWRGVVGEVDHRSSNVRNTPEVDELEAVVQDAAQGEGVGRVRDGRDGPRRRHLGRRVGKHRLEAEAAGLLNRVGLVGSVRRKIRSNTTTNQSKIRSNTNPIPQTISYLARHGVDVVGADGGGVGAGLVGRQRQGKAEAAQFPRALYTNMHAWFEMLRGLRRVRFHPDAFTYNHLPINTQNHTTTITPKPAAPGA